MTGTLTCTWGTNPARRRMSKGHITATEYITQPCVLLNMSVRDVSNALRHVHNNLDVDTQWRRAKSGLAEMTDLERVQVWTALSSHTLSMDEKTAPVVFSQYKTLYKAALKKTPDTCQVKLHESEDATVMLDEYKQCLEKYQGFLTPLVDIRRDGKDQIIINVNEVIGNSTLLTDMKKQIQDTLDKAIKDLASEADITQLKATLASIKAEKAEESSVVKISETLAAIQTKLEMLTSKLGNSTLGALAEQVNNGATRIGAVETSHEKLRASIDQLSVSLGKNTTEIKALQSDLAESHWGVENMTGIVTKLNTSVGILTEERKHLADAYSEIKQRIQNAETSSDATKLAVDRLDEESKSYATLEDIEEFIERLNTSEESGAKEPKAPRIHPFAESQHKGGVGPSKIIQEKGHPRGRVRGGKIIDPPPKPAQAPPRPAQAPWLTEFNPHNNTDFNLWPTSPSSSQSAPGSP